MKRVLIIGAILLLAAGGLSFNRLIWISPDYETAGLCSTEDIDKTYAALSYADGFRYAAGARASYELWRIHGGFNPRLRGGYKMKTEIVDWNRELFLRFGKRKSAAYLCNHVSAYFATTPKLRLIPDMAKAINPFVKKPSQVWPLATCIATMESYRAGPLSQERIISAQERCDERDARAKRRH